MCFPKIRKNKQKNKPDKPDKSDNFEEEVTHLRENFDINKFNSLFNEKQRQEQEHQEQIRQEQIRQEQELEQIRQEQERRYRINTSHIFKVMVMNSTH